MMRRSLWLITAFLFCSIDIGSSVRSTIQPACILPFYFTAAGVKSLPDNNGTQCINWTVAYAASNMAALSLSVQEAPDAGNTAGTFVDWGGTVVSGGQPNTATTQAATQLNGYYRWVRVKLTGTFAAGGLVAGVLYGSSNAFCGGCRPAGVEFAAAGGLR
jgi:hypothetical protein